MSLNTIFIRVVILILLAVLGAGCTGTPDDKEITPMPIASRTPTATDLSTYAFPVSIDPSAHYMFYLHGRIVEDQGIPAISPDFGEYKYLAILEKLAGYGFTVISEHRGRNADGLEHARRVAQQVQTLLDAGVPPGNITVVGASKGGGIAMYVSHYLGNEDANFVILSACHPDTVVSLINEGTFLVGNVLSIYDEVDTLAGSCRKLFTYSEGKGIGRHEEIVLHIGTGHGILYQPLDAWVAPTVEWAGK
jgi:hypothetical protein